jgi:hypothetical protein
VCFTAAAARSVTTQNPCRVQQRFDQGRRGEHMHATSFFWYDAKDIFSMTTIETHEANEPMTFPAESLMMTTHDKDKYVVVLPCWGSPYIHGIVRKKGMTGDELNLLRKAVKGTIGLYDRKEFVIHPDFCSENRRWDLAQQLLTRQYTEVYVNDDFPPKFGVNTGTIITNPARRPGGCPHLKGNVALVVPKRVFEMLCPNPRTMMLYKNPKTSDEGENGLENGCWEFGDEEETDKATKYFEEKGYDFEEDIGFCWLAKFYSSDEEEDESDASDMF